MRTVAAIDQDNFVHASGVLVAYVPTYGRRAPCMAYVAISDTELKGDIAMHTRHGLSPCKDACCKTVCAQCSDLDGHVRRIVFLCLEVKSLRTLPRGSLDIRWSLCGRSFDLQVLTSALHEQLRLDEIMRR